MGKSKEQKLIFQYTRMAQVNEHTLLHQRSLSLTKSNLIPIKECAKH